MTPPASDRPEPWSLARLLLVRFGIIYLALYAGPPACADLPGIGRLVHWYLGHWYELVAWLGRLVLQIDVQPPMQNGSGDQLAQYVELVVLLLVAGLGTLAWSLADRGRRDHRGLVEVLRVYLRYMLAFTMFSYGMAKVLKSQFPEPSAARLLMPIGETSPMGLLWTFMGHSKAYTILAGLAEVAGGVLLLFRRTTTLGALVLFGVLVNVVAMNYAYDVPVKLFSSHLLLMVVILLARDARRLFAALLLNRPVPAADLGQAPLVARWPRGVRIAKAILVSTLLFLTVRETWIVYTSYGDGREKGPLEGAYRVVAMEKDGVATSPSDPQGWRQVGISGHSFLTVAGDGALGRYGCMIDPVRGTLMLMDRFDPSRTGELTAVRAGDEVRLEGTLGGTRISVRMRPMGEEFLLPNRGFHWVNEEPFNR